MRACGVYLGDNDGTCPQLTCIRDRGHRGLCDNVDPRDDEWRFDDWLPRLGTALYLLLVRYIEIQPGAVVGDGQERLADLGWMPPEWLVRQEVGR